MKVVTTLTEEDRRIARELCDEERRERNRAFWKVYPDDTESDDGEYLEKEAENEDL